MSGPHRPTQRIHLRQHSSRFLLQDLALRGVILLRILARLIFKIQIAQVGIDLLLQLFQKIQPRLLPLRNRKLLRPEGLKKERQRQHSPQNHSRRTRHRNPRFPSTYKN